MSCRQLAWAVVGCIFACGSLALGQATTPQLGRPVTLRSQPPAAPGLAFPATGKPSKRTGLRLNVAAGTDSFGYGYFPIEIRVESPLALKANTIVTVRCTVGTRRMSDRSNELEFETSVELATGATVAAKTILVPETFTHYSLACQTWVDGRLDRELSSELNSFQYFGWNTPQQGSALSVARAGRTSGFTPTPGERFGSLEFANSNFDAGATSWLAHCRHDVFLVDLIWLESYAANASPASMAALRRWVASGGNLWIENCGPDWQHLNRVSSMLPLDNQLQPPESLRLGHRIGRAGWQAHRFDVPVGSDGPMTDAAGLLEDFGLPFDRMRPGNPNSSNRQPRQDAVVDSSNWFLVQKLGFGKVTVFQNSWSDHPARVHRSVEAMVGDNWSTSEKWPVRHGMVPGASHPEFSNWLIPSVGLAPVVEFQVLITLLVVVLGPLNYYLLWRLGKPNLLLVTVPATAAIATILLLLYGVLSDGFSTRVRGRSLTLLDQRTGEAVSQGRLSYYAAFAPPSGLTFPEDSAIYPIMPDDRGSWSDMRRSDQRKLKWDDRGNQLLTQGWLPSRTPTQLLVIRARKSPLQVQIQESTSGVAATNRLGVAVRQLLVIDSSGKWHTGQNLEPEQHCSLTPAIASDALKQYRKALANTELRYPEALASGEDPLEALGGSYRYGRNQTMDYLLSGSRLEQKWQELLGSDGGPALDLERGSFIAVTSDTFELPIGLEGVRQQDGVHLLVARYADHVEPTHSSDNNVIDSE